MQRRAASSPRTFEVAHRETVRGAHLHADPFATHLLGNLGRPTQPVQRKASGGETGSMPTGSSGGQPLPTPLRAKMERALGADFAAVRIHEGAQASALGAVAYTQGTDIHFAPGRYQPDSQQGQELLGHELAHVVQQSQGRVQATTQAKGVAINDDRSLEREADELGARAARGEAVDPHGALADPSTVTHPGGEAVQEKCEACEDKQRARSPSDSAATARPGNARHDASDEKRGRKDKKKEGAAGACSECGGAPAQAKAACDASDAPVQRQSEVAQLHASGAGALGQVVQLWPGDGMVPPGDCSWARYLALRGAVEGAKAVVSALGACSADDSCPVLATKIAAITGEIAARVALDATCFKGGDTGHRQQVQDKVAMLNRCYRHFQNQDCAAKLAALAAAAAAAAAAARAAAAAAAEAAAEAAEAAAALAEAAEGVEIVEGGVTLLEVLEGLGILLAL